MGDPTAAERQRRYRAHKRGDHSLCPPDRPDCVTVTSPEPRNAVTPPVEQAPDLGSRGQRLWTELTGDGTYLRPAERVLIEEACRLADRLDVLDRLLRGDEDAWVRLHGLNDDGSVVKVVVNNVLAEARQQQIALKQLLGELRQSRSGAIVPKTPGARLPEKEGAGDDRTGASGAIDFAARLAAKGRRAPTG